MVKINYNERSWAIDLISEINYWCKNKDITIKRAGGEQTLLSKEHLFPDVLLYGDEKAGLIIQGWELKMPDTPIDDEKFINNAYKKAKVLGLDSFLLWNCSEAALYKIKDESYIIIKKWDDLVYIKSRKEVKKYEKQWKDMLYTILNDLNYYFENNEIKPISTIDSVTNDNIVNLILNNEKNVANEIKHAAIEDVEIEDKINIWWSSAKSEYDDKIDSYLALSRLILVNWMNKFLFANLLKKYYHKAKLVEQVINDISIEDGIKIINEISNNCDFKNIFKILKVHKYIPNNTWNVLKNYNKLLIDLRLDNLNSENISKLLMNITENSTKKASGQFVTPKNLAYFLSYLTILNKKSTILDPCCGTGTIIKACYDIKKSYDIDPDLIRTSLWASDKYQFPLQIAMISLSNPESFGKVLNIFQSDVNDLKVSNEISFTDPLDGKKINKKLPQFDYIISNLPFIKQENIKKYYSEMKNNVENIISETDSELTLSGKSDFYAYIPFKLWELLKSNGCIGLIISNSWLSSNWGNNFYRSLKIFYNIKYIITSSNEKWFDNADVITTILILEKKENIPNVTESPVSYIKLNINIHDESFIDKVPELCSFIRQGINSEHYSMVSYTNKDEDDILKLGVSKNSLFENIKWLYKIKNKLIKANKIFEIGRGERRGWDDLFYPPKNHNIEEDYIKKVVKNQKEVESYVTKANDDAFCCSLSEKELIEANHTNALNWIKKFEKGVNKTNNPLPEVLKKKNMFWYEMKSDTMADICISINPGDRLFFSRLVEKSFVNQRLIRFNIKNNNSNIKLLNALLNSILGLFYIESLGFGRGLGALDLNATNVRDNLFMLNPDLLTEEDKKIILDKYSLLEARDVEKLEIELNLKDRIDFDKTLLKIYNIDHLYDEIKLSLLNIYKRRKKK